MRLIVKFTIGMHWILDLEISSSYYVSFLYCVSSCCSGQHLWRPGKQGHVKGKGGASGAGHKEAAGTDDTKDFTV